MNICPKSIGVRMDCRGSIVAFGGLMFLVTGSFRQANAQATYTLKPTAKTVAWGYYDAKAAPVLRVKSGDTVEIQTLITNSPKGLEDGGLPPEQVEQSLRDITDQVKDKGPGGHILTGPVYIEGAEPGDGLEVKILAIKLAIPYAYNGFGPGRGYLPDDYPYAKMKIIPLDEKRMEAKFAPGIEIPLHPFFGIMCEARRPRDDRFPRDRKTSLARRRLHALERRRRSPHHRTRRRQQRRPHDAPQIHLCRVVTEMRISPLLLPVSVMAAICLPAK